jgi:hypothetical protein
VDLAALESEAFLLGQWSNYEHLETSLSMPELLSTLEASREKSNNERRFQIALAGGDPDAAGEGSLSFDQIREQERLRAQGVIDKDTPDEVANAIAAGNIYFVDNE